MSMQLCCYVAVVNHSRHSTEQENLFSAQLVYEIIYIHLLVPIRGFSGQCATKSGDTCQHFGHFIYLFI